jgi:hypothetical protein
MSEVQKKDRHLHWLRWLLLLLLQEEVRFQYHLREQCRTTRI